MPYQMMNILFVRRAKPGNEHKILSISGCAVHQPSLQHDELWLSLQSSLRSAVAAATCQVSLYYKDGVGKQVGLTKLCPPGFLVQH